MALYLVQHGQSLPKEQDPESGLSETGMAESRLIAEATKRYRVTVSAICHSGKKRALQTTEIFSEVLLPKGGIRQLEGLNPMDDVAAFAKTIRNDQNIMYIGHLPFMERLTTYLVADRLEPPVLKFQNSGIVCLELDLSLNAWVIQWTLMPHIS